MTINEEKHAHLLNVNPKGPADFKSNVSFKGGEDLINKPPHYTQYKGLEVIDLTEQMNFNRGNVIKYICRAGYKSKVTEVDDLEKAKWYLEREIGRLKEENGIS